MRIPVDGSPLPPPLTIQAEDTLEPFPMLRIPGTNAILCRVSTWGEKGYQETVQVLDLTTGEMTLLVENAQRASLLPDGRLLVSRHDTLLAIPFDRQTLSITGGPQPVASGLRAENTWQGAWFDLSDNGTLVHLPGGLIGPERRLVYLQDGTRALPWSEERRSYNVRVTASRDGSRFAVIVANATQLYEVWVADLDTPRLKRFVSEPGQDCYPAAWTADNQRLVYYCLGDPKGQGIFIKPLDGSAPAETILRDDRTVFMGLVAQALAPDGETLIVMRQEKTGRVPYSVSMAVDAQGERPLQPLEGMAQAQEISFSPDGKWLAYISDISGRNQAYVRRYHPGSHLGPENPITSQGASDVEWARGTDNGGLRLLVTRPGAGRTFAIDMTAEPRLRFSQPELVLEPALLNPGFVSMTDLPDGRWFGIQQGPNEGDTDSISLVLNWRQDMMRRSAGE